MAGSRKSRLGAVVPVSGRYPEVHRRCVERCPARPLRLLRAPAASRSAGTIPYRTFSPAIHAPEPRRRPRKSVPELRPGSRDGKALGDVRPRERRPVRRDGVHRARVSGLHPSFPFPAHRRSRTRLGGRCGGEDDDRHFEPESSRTRKGPGGHPRPYRRRNPRPFRFRRSRKRSGTKAMPTRR